MDWARRKLMIEHRKAAAGARRQRSRKGSGSSSRWNNVVNAQRFTFLLKVKYRELVGIKHNEKWRFEAGCIDFYRHVYEPFSATAHNTWQHISRWLTSLPGATTRYIDFTSVAAIPMDEGRHSLFMALAAKYAEKALTLCIDKFGVTKEPICSYQRLFWRKSKRLDVGSTVTGGGRR